MQKESMWALIAAFVLIGVMAVVIGDCSKHTADTKRVTLEVDVNYWGPPESMPDTLILKKR